MYGRYFTLLMTIVFLIVGMVAESVAITYSEDTDYIYFNHDKIELRYKKSDMYCKVSFNKGAIIQSINHDDGAWPSDWIKLSGINVLSFPVTSNNCADINTVHGTGKKLTITGEATVGGAAVEKTLTVELYDQYPDVAITSAIYKNLGSTDLSIDQVWSGCYLLDATLVGKITKHEFHYMHGGQGRRLDTIDDQILGSNIQWENCMWRDPADKNNTDSGAGAIPFTYLWNDEMGMGTYMLEPKFRHICRPIQVNGAGDGNVVIGIRFDPAVSTTLAAQSSYTAYKTMIGVSTGDFWTTCRRYTELQIDEGYTLAEPVENDYRIEWQTWGFGRTYELTDINNILPDLLEIGVEAITFDDGWETEYGDGTCKWSEADLIDCINNLHNNGLIAMLWTHLYCPSTTSNLAIDHPEWLIENPAGTKWKESGWWGNWYLLCTAHNAAVQNVKDRITKYIQTWDFDGFKHDGTYTHPPCFDTAHDHGRNPYRSEEAFAEITKTLFDLTRSLKPGATVLICPCGSMQNYWMVQGESTPIMGDPEVQNWHQTGISPSSHNQDISTGAVFMSSVGAKLYHALFPGLAIKYHTVGDYVKAEFGVKQCIGTGEVPQMWDNSLTASEKTMYKKYFDIYKSEMISKATYHGELYDFYYDVPETHCLQKDTTMYYAFISDGSYNGTVELRGLESGTTYDVIDYEDNTNLGTVIGPTDTTPPIIDSVSCNKPTKVKVKYSEAVEETFATNTSNYSIDNSVTIYLHRKFE